MKNKKIDKLINLITSCIYIEEDRKKSFSTLYITYNSEFNDIIKDRKTKSLFLELERGFNITIKLSPYKFFGIWEKNYLI